MCVCVYRSALRVYTSIMTVLTSKYIVWYWWSSLVGNCLRIRLYIDSRNRLFLSFGQEKKDLRLQNGKL